MGIAAALEDFLTLNRISQDDWEKANCDWDVLRAIAEDHERSQELLRETAEAFARIIQKFPAVHSVRWRVKDANHLLEKIVRKKASGSAKYRDLGVDNYQKIVTDLVGIRAIHLFKDECFEIDKSLKSVWQAAEPPIAYLRKGDEALRDLFVQRGFTVEDHAAGYRSVHYVFPSSLTQREIHVEVQVRTIFEEGWSEIDHRVRYPNFDSAPEVDMFLTIFNRTAGSADEMGSFVRDLALVFRTAKATTAQLEQDRDDAAAVMAELVDQLSDAERKGQKQTETIEKMRAQISKLERANASARSAGSILSGLSEITPNIRNLAALGLNVGDSGLANLINTPKLDVTALDIAKFGLPVTVTGIDPVLRKPQKKPND